SDLRQGATLSDTGGAIPSGAKVVSFGAGIVLMDTPALTTTSLEAITYTNPGDFAIERPLRIRNSFTRITGTTGLDYFIDVVSFERYNEIGLKSVPGPWPY